MTDIKFPGIYFGLSDEEYHAVPAFSNSGISNILTSPLTFWSNSWMNPNYVDTPSPARKVGKAYHKMILEGDEAFEAAYAVAPSKEDHPEAIDGGAALKAHLDGLGLSKSGTIADMCQRIRSKDREIQLWPDIMADFVAWSEGKEIIDLSLWNQIQQARYVINNTPSISSAFTNGHSEVSLFWTDQGVPMKCRIDYLKFRRDVTTGKDIASIVDLKTFANQMNREIREAIVWEISNRKYFCQPVTYTKGLQAIKESYREGRLHIEGDVDPDWIKGLLLSDLERFFLVFVQSGDIPNVASKAFDEWETYGGNGSTRNAYWHRGWAEYARGLELFLQCRKQYGTDVPWVTDYGVTSLKDDDFPPYALETRHVA